MVFEKLTLFEIRLDDARFSNAIGTESSSDEELETESADAVSADEESATGGSRARRVARLVAVGALVSIAATLAIRRFTGGGEDEAETAEIEFEDDIDAVA